MIEDHKQAMRQMASKAKLSAEQTDKLIAHGVTLEIAQKASAKGLGLADILGLVTKYGGTVANVITDIMDIIGKYTPPPAPVQPAPAAATWTSAPVVSEAPKKEPAGETTTNTPKPLAKKEEKKE